MNTVRGHCTTYTIHGMFCIVALVGRKIVIQDIQCTIHCLTWNGMDMMCRPVDQRLKNKIGDVVENEDRRKQKCFRFLIWLVCWKGFIWFCSRNEKKSFMSQIRFDNFTATIIVFVGLVASFCRCKHIKHRTQKPKPRTHSRKVYYFHFQSYTK